MTVVYESLRYDNQFRFTCPVFDAETRMGACTQLRDLVYKGLQPEKRLGCQVAIRCGKCPAAEMVRLYCFNKSWLNDHHGSMEPKQGKLMRVLLENIRRTMIQDRMVNGYNISDKERELLLTANDRIDQQLKSAPGESSRLGKTVDTKPVSRQFGKEITAKEEKKSSADSAINKAAMTGDIAAAINA